MTTKRVFIKKERESREIIIHPAVIFSFYDTLYCYDI